MAPRYRVTLTDEERIELTDLTKTCKTNAKRFLNARVLLLCDTSPDAPAWQVAKVATAMGVTPRTVEHLKKRFVEQGLDAALERKKADRPSREIKFDGAFEARLIALACTDAPEGSARWTVRLLADRVVELNLAPSVSHMTIQRILKKTNLSLTSPTTGKSRRREARNS